MSQDYTEQYTPYGVLKRLPDKEHYWLDSRLTHTPAKRLRDRVPVIAILSPEDQQQLKTYYTQLRDLDLRGVLDDTVYISTQIKGVCYQCECKIFYYEKPGDECLNYPKTCPLGHPAYEDF